MKKLISVLLVLLVVGCTNGQKKDSHHSNHMGMRAMDDHDELGCKNGRIWKQVSDDDWVDIGPVTDSCNCNRKPIIPCIPDDCKACVVQNMVFYYGRFVMYVSPNDSYGMDKLFHALDSLSKL